MQYRRAKNPGSSYFFTLVTYNRRSILCEPENIDLLRDSFKRVIDRHPFTIDAIVILPDHLHCIWTLPPEDSDFSTRWRLVKSWFSRRCHVKYQGTLSASRQSKQEKAIWQRRFWEHLIREIWHANDSAVRSKVSNTFLTSESAEPTCNLYWALHHCGMIYNQGEIFTLGGRT